MASLRENERAWIRGAQAGSLPDLEALFREHWTRAYRAAYLVALDSAASEEMAQETFLGAIRTLDRFDRGRPFGSWLHKIVVNHAINWSTARSLRAEIGEPALELAAGRPGARGLPYSQPMLSLLAELSPEHRAVIVLRHLLGYTPREISRVLDLPRGTVSSRLRRGLDELAPPDGGRWPTKDQDLRLALLAAAPPGEVAAQRRSWQLARAAFDEREPTPWPQRNASGLILAAAVVGVLAAVLSPQGREAISDFRAALGTETVVGRPRGRPAPFTLPARGRLLVTAPTGSWIVAANGSRRRLGDYDEAAWGSRNPAVVASTRSRLAALAPNGKVRWSLTRPRVHDARWSPSGLRVAYLSGANLRMVAGDGTDDGRLAGALAVAPAWRPVEEHVLAYVDRDENLTVLETDTAETLWSAATGPGPLQLEWSSDGRRLLVVTSTGSGRFTISVYDEGGRRLQSLIFPGRFADAAFAPDDHRIALARQRAGRSELLLVDGDVLRRQQPVFSGAGRFGDLAWAPGGRWLVLGWESADQWLFIRSTDVEKIKAVSSLAKQFDPGGTGAGSFPRIEGWCCPG